jgi:cell division protein FtsI (penicillin-binding protein 3)
MQKPNEYDNKRKKTLRWGYLFAVVALCVFVMFLARIVILQNTNVQEIKDDYINKNYREATLKAARGNLFASDGSILATTVMRYDIYLDFKTMKDTVYTNNIGALTDSLSKMFGKSRGEFRKKFDEQRKKKNQYYALAKGLDFDQYDRIRKFPIFKKGKNKGGFIVDRNYKRELATSEIGAGTIGMDNGEYSSGLEGAFSKYLRGTDGKRLEQRINSSQWKPIDFWKVQEPVDGEDV